MRILIAPNAFKNSLNATDAASAICQGLKISGFADSCECFPIGDGGDGTGDLLIEKCGGELIPAEVHDPLGRKIKTTFGLIDDGNTAVIEMANASGIRLLKPDEQNPLHASTSGTGELIKLALDKGAGKIIITMGGSATVDGGTGILHSLGVRFLDDNDKELSTLPKDLPHLRSIDLAGIDKRILNCELVVLCDVDNMLLGHNGSAAVFGPQKGATPAMVTKLEDSLSVLTQVAHRQTGISMATLKYGGTAGGAAAGLCAFLNAKLVNGIDYFLQITDFDKALEKCDLLITGEGSIDLQTIQGKAPFGVASRAKSKNIPVIGLAGKVPLVADTNLRKYFNILLPIGNEPSDIETALKFTADNLIRTSMEIGNLIKVLLKKSPDDK